MAIVVIGGHSRDVGKTSVVAGLIAAMRDRNWLAIKITQYGHGICSANGEACDCVTADHSLAVTEERSRAGETDTSRFLVAGAERVLWVRTQQGMLAEAMPRVRAEIAKAENVIIESNSVMKFLRPDLVRRRAGSLARGFQEERARISGSRRTQSSCVQPMAKWNGRMFR